MSFNGSGTFLINSTGQPVVANTVISATVFNALTADLASGLTNCITKDGQSTPTANIPMGSNKITGLANGTLIGDAANLGQVQSTVAKLISITGTDTVLGTMSPTLTAYAAGQLFYFIASGANTGAVTLNVDGLGAKAITRDGSTALAAGDINSGEIVVVIYDGTRFQMINAANSFGNTTINGTLTVTGNTGLQANVSVTSALSVGGTFAVTGAATLGSTLAVTGKSDLPTVSTASANAAVAVITDLSAAGASITSANVGTAVVTTGTVTNLTATSASVASVNAGVALLTTATVTNLTATGASIASANLGNAVISALTLTGVSVASANVGVANITDLRAVGASVTSANLGTAVVTNGTVTNLTATSASVASVNAAVALLTTATVTTLTASGASIASANIGNLQFTAASIASINAGVAVINNLTATSASIASANVGTAVITTGTVTSLTATGASVASANVGTAVVTGLTVTGASIASMNGVTANITNVNATTVDATNVEVTNVKAKDGTAAIVISDTSGNVGIGGTAAQSYDRLETNGTLPLSGGISVAINNRATVPDGASTGAYGHSNNLFTAAASFTIANYYHYFAFQQTLGAGSAVTNQHGYYVDSTLTGATNNYGFYGNIASGTNRYNVYMAGTADNYFAGNVGIGTAPSKRLHVANNSTNAEFLLSSTQNVYADFYLNTWALDRALIRAEAANPGSGSGTGSGALSFWTARNPTMTEAMRIDSSGNVGIGGTAATFSKLNITGTLPTASNTTHTIRNDGTIPSGSTGTSYGYVNILNTQAASFTASAYNHFFAFQSALGAGSAVTDQYGFAVSSTLTGATNNYGFYSNIASGSNRYNFFANGTAINYFAGNTGIGVNVAASNIRLFVRGANQTAGQYTILAQDGSANNLFFVENNGNVTAPPTYSVTVGGTNRDLYIDNTGLIGYVSSIRASKTNIENLADVSWLKSLNPVSYQYRKKDEAGHYTDEADGGKDYGLIAEDVEAVAPELCFYDTVDGNSELRGVTYSKLITPMLKYIQQLESRIAALEAK